LGDREPASREYGECREVGVDSVAVIVEMFGREWKW
jgi:hypothetical protein